MAFNVTVTGPSAGTYPVTLTLSNVETNSGIYSGALQFTAGYTIGFGNYPITSGSNRDITTVSTVKYD